MSQLLRAARALGSLGFPLQAFRPAVAELSTGLGVAAGQQDPEARARDLPEKILPQDPRDSDESCPASQRVPTRSL